MDRLIAAIDELKTQLTLTRLFLLNKRIKNMNRSYRIVMYTPNNEVGFHAKLSTYDLGDMQAAFDHENKVRAKYDAVQMELANVYYDYNVASATASWLTNRASSEKYKVVKNDWYCNN